MLAEVAGKAADALHQGEQQGDAGRSRIDAGAAQQRRTLRRAGRGLAVAQRPRRGRRAGMVHGRVEVEIEAPQQLREPVCPELEALRGGSLR